MTIPGKEISRSGTSDPPPQEPPRKALTPTEHLERFRETERSNLYAEREQYRAELDASRNQAATFASSNMFLATENRNLKREVRANSLVSLIAGAAIVVGGSVISYADSKPTRLLALVIVCTGASIAVAMGGMALFKNDREPALNRYLAAILLFVILFFIALNYQEIGVMFFRLVYKTTKL